MKRVLVVLGFLLILAWVVLEFSSGSGQAPSPAAASPDDGAAAAVRDASDEGGADPALRQTDDPVASVDPVVSEEEDAPVSGIEVRVQRPGGYPAAHVYVELHAVEGESTARVASATSDRAGVAALGDPASGRYLVTADPSGEARFEHTQGARSEVVVAVRRVLRGRCVTSDGEPLVRVRVALTMVFDEPFTMASGELAPRKLERRTDSSGSFAFEDCPVALMRMRVEDDRFLLPLANREVRPEESFVEVVVPSSHLEASWVRGRVVDPVGDGPLPRVSLAPDSPWSRSGRIARPDAEGQFALGPLQAGRYLMALSPESGGVDQALEPIELQPGADHDLGTIVVAQPGSYTLHLSGVDELERASIGLKAESVYIELERDGNTFHAARVPSGTYRLQGDARGLPPWGRQVVIAAGQHLEERLAIPPSGGVRFTFEPLGREGQLRGYLLRFLDRDGFVVKDVKFSTDASNNQLTPFVLQPGVHTIEVKTSDGLVGREDFRVVAGEEISCVVRLY